VTREIIYMYKGISNWHVLKPLGESHISLSVSSIEVCHETVLLNETLIAATKHMASRMVLHVLDGTALEPLIQPHPLIRLQGVAGIPMAG
jgi:hypothetical protein